MNLHVIAYPELAVADYETIQSFRRDYNSLYTVIEPHFTIVFAVANMTPTDFTEEVRQRVKDIDAIPFCLRCAAINKDAFSNNYDAFLVPDEGFSRISRLHDRLYSKKLLAHHRLDIPYIPHISIGNSPDAQAIKRIVDQWNEKDFAICGKIAALDIIKYERRVVATLTRISLRQT